jgi:hypothetical protein
MSRTPRKIVSIGGASVVALAVFAYAQPAWANAAAREFFTPSTGEGALTAANTRQVRVQAVSLALDFRLAHRGDSTAEYLLANLSDQQAWEDEVIFVSTAYAIGVTIDGNPVAARSYGRHFSQRPDIAKALKNGANGNGFRVHLAPSQQCRIVIVFRNEPASHTTNPNHQFTRDGLTPLHALTAVPSYDFTYPLWPAYGFEGGVGPMGIALLTSRGALPPSDSPTSTWTSQPLPQGETRWILHLPEARSIEQAPLQEVEIRYPRPISSRWRLGASAFAGARFATQNERSAAAHLAVSVDTIVADLGAFTLGGETSFTHSASLSLGFQRGESGSFASYYLGGAALLSFGPSATPGFELRTGFRLVWLPLDLAVQTHPFVTPGEGHVARFRFIAGVRMRVW